MTNGIIQEVLAKYKEIHGTGTHPIRKAKLILINQIEIELIEKIKQYELLCYKDNGQPTTYVPKIRLIGDNQK